MPAHTSSAMSIMFCMTDVPEEIAIQLAGHANIKMIHEVYMALKPKIIEDTRAALDTLISAPTAPTKTPA